MWWPGIDEDIEKYGKSYELCQRSDSKGSGIKAESWPSSSHVFERVHIDFFFFQTDTFLILVDSYSKFIDVKEMNNSTNATELISKLRTIYSYFGLPKLVVSDNGPPFYSKLYDTFCVSNGILKRNSPIYFPQSKGLAERGVQTVKKALKKFLLDNSYRKIPIQYKLDNFLMGYRNTPTTTTMKTPAKLMFNYRPRTRLDYLKRETKEAGWRKGNDQNGPKRNLTK